jgi:putative alpha-1,2-mannosidase
MPTLSRGVPSASPADLSEADPERYLRIDFPAGGGRVRIPWEGEGDELSYDVFPVAGTPDRYAATAFAIEIVLDDGTVLEATDHHGTPLHPADQADAKRLWVDQWNRVIVVLGRSRIRELAAVSAAADPSTVFLDTVRVREAVPEPVTLLGAADTRRGTHASAEFSRGNTAPLVGLPHGGVFALPMTDASAGNWPYRWQMSEPALQGFATSHLPSPWIGDRGVFQLMPSPVADPDPSREARALRFDRDTELARPDIYRVALSSDEGRIDATLAADDHAVGLRAESHSGALAIIVDHLGEAVDASWAVDGGELRIDVRLRDASGEHFVHARIPDPASVRLVREGGRLRGSVEIAGARTDVVVGVSSIGPDEARDHAAAGIDDMLCRAHDAWVTAFSRLEVEGAPPALRRAIAGSLARVFAYPNRHDEDGRYRSPVDGGVRDGAFSSNNGFWDTYRTAWPLLGLLAPRTAARLADGFVQHFRDAGWVARWSAPGPVDSMTGTTSDTVFAGLAEQGVAIDLDAAYASAFRHATLPSADPRVGRKGLGPARFRGYVDIGTHEGLGWTLDGAINDGSAARLAELLIRAGGDTEELHAEHEYLARRALSYRDSFHRGFFRGRDAEGTWREPFDPDEWGHDYTETNAWGTAFTAPHDGAGLAALHGGEAALGTALDAMLAREETADKPGSYGFVIHEMTEARDTRMGMLALSNQPGHHIPFMYAFAGRHDDAHRLVVEARDRLFVGGEIGQGYPGDEDNGEMSAWYLFTTIGLYPLVPGSGEFVLTPPRLPRVVLRPEGRDPIVIEATNPGAHHIREVRVDGAPWDRISIGSAELATVQHIEFVLADEPSGWAADTRPGSFSAEFDVSAPLRDLLRTVPGSVTDDEGTAPVALAAGESLEAALADPATVGLYALTSAGDPAPLPMAVPPVTARWRLEGLTPGGWVLLDEREASFDRAQTRPFPARAALVSAIRLTTETPLELAQIEVFAA